MALAPLPGCLRSLTVDRLGQGSSYLSALTSGQPIHSGSQPNERSQWRHIEFQDNGRHLFVHRATHVIIKNGPNMRNRTKGIRFGDCGKFTAPNLIGFNPWCEV
jgi:hypothetical protein